MTAGSKGMGMRKHGKSGWKNGAGKSPRFRMAAKLEAEKNERKAKPSTCLYGSVKEMLSK